MLFTVATGGSSLDFLRQLCLELGAPELPASAAKLTRLNRDAFTAFAAKRQQPILIIDESHLLRLELLAAAAEKCSTVTAEHVRLALTEIL